MEPIAAIVLAGPLGYFAALAVPTLRLGLNHRGATLAERGA